MKLQTHCGFIMIISSILSLASAVLSAINTYRRFPSNCQEPYLMNTNLVNAIVYSIITVAHIAIAFHVAKKPLIVILFLINMMTLNWPISYT